MTLCPRCSFPLARLSNGMSYGAGTPAGMAHIDCVLGKRVMDHLDALAATDEIDDAAAWPVAQNTGD